MKTLTALLLFALATPASALTGNEFLRAMAKPEDHPDYLYAYGYFTGVLTLYLISGNGGYCTHAPPEATTEQLRRVVVKYLTDNPAKTHINFVTLSTLALEDAYGFKPVTEEGYCV